MDLTSLLDKGSFSPANAKKLRQLLQSLGEAMPQVLRPGFHGCVELEIRVQDGTIQLICRKVEKIER